MSMLGKAYQISSWSSVKPSFSNAGRQANLIMGSGPHTRICGCVSTASRGAARFSRAHLCATPRRWEVLLDHVGGDEAGAERPACGRAVQGIVHLAQSPLRE